MFTELATDTAGACFQLLSLTQQNILDCRTDPTLYTWIEELLTEGGIIYGRESPDVWTSAAAERWREQERARGRLGRRAHLPQSRMQAHRLAFRGLAGVGKKKHRIRQDCEDIAAEIGAWAFLSGRFRRVRVCVTEPHGVGVSHAYNELDDLVVDGAADFGMRSTKTQQRPPLSWYRQPRTVMFDVHEVRPSVVI